jgi:hypothetical protein
MQMLKRLLWAAAAAVVVAFVALGMAAMWMVGQLPH